MLLPLKGTKAISAAAATLTRAFTGAPASTQPASHAASDPVSGLSTGAAKSRWSSAGQLPPMSNAALLDVKRSRWVGVS
ncbi:MAG: hypothetical protein M3513_05220, partial [Actinomycetota bacterium]|nr:hypothetical protein [Actinomycetota bacterium]